jgi:hypothetical protein
MWTNATTGSLVLELPRRRPGRAGVVAAAPVVDGKRPHAALVADPRRVLGDERRDLAPVRGREFLLRLASARAGQPHRTRDRLRDRSRQHTARNAASGRDEHAAEQQRDTEDDPDPLDGALSALAAPSRAHVSTLGGAGSRVGDGCRDRVPGAGRLLGAGMSNALRGSLTPC